jgi:flagellar biosynthesis/type III secretory pathway M-ring protein FliF/YscJ
VSGSLDVLATDGLRVLGTLGFFVPAAILVALVVVAVVRDRRLSAREAAEDAAEAGKQREALGDYEGLRGDGTPPYSPSS